MAFPLDSGYFDQYSLLHGNLDIADIQNPQPHTTDEVRTVWNGYVTIQAYNMAKSIYLKRFFPPIPIGKGGWYYKCSLGFSQFTKIRLLDPRGQFLIFLSLCFII